MFFGVFFFSILLQSTKINTHNGLNDDSPKWKPSLECIQTTVTLSVSSGLSWISATYMKEDTPGCCVRGRIAMINIMLLKPYPRQNPTEHCYNPLSHVLCRVASSNVNRFSLRISLFVINMKYFVTICR